MEVTLKHAKMNNVTISFLDTKIEKNPFLVRIAGTLNK